MLNCLSLSISRLGEAARVCTETRPHGAVSDTIYDEFSLPRRLAVASHSPTLLGQLSISLLSLLGSYITYISPMQGSEPEYWLSH